MSVAPPVPATPVSVAPPVPPAPVSVAPLAPVAPTAKPVAPAKSAPPPPPSAVVAKVPAAHARKNEGTVREILPPWHVLQEKLQKGNAPAPVGEQDEVVNRAAQEALAAQEAANARWGIHAESVEMPPSSGVRMSEPGQVVQASHAIATPQPGAPEPAILHAGQPGQAAQVPDSLLSFKVYTLAELERRSDSRTSTAPVSMRSSRASFDLTSSRSSRHWQRVGVALRAFAAASLAWFKTTGLRPSVKVALRKPFDELGDELQVAVESVNWKKLGVTTGIVVGATLTLLFAVLTAAELTDDLKSPGSTARLASSETSGLPARTALDQHGVAPATNMAAMGVQPVAPAPIVIAPSADATTTIGDIDAPGDAPATPVKKKKAAKPKINKLTLRSAPF